MVEEPVGRWQGWLYPRSGQAVTCCFLGRLDGTTFKVVRIIGYRNSFLPVIRGRITQHGQGADVRLVMTLHPLVALFLLVWFTGLGTAVFGNLEAAGSLFAALPLGLCLFGAAVTLAGFVPEALEAKRIMREKLDAP